MSGSNRNGGDLYLSDDGVGVDDGGGVDEARGRLPRRSLGRDWARGGRKQKKKKKKNKGVRASGGRWRSELVRERWRTCVETPRGDEEAADGAGGGGGHGER